MTSIVRQLFESYDPKQVALSAEHQRCVGIAAALLELRYTLSAMSHSGTLTYRATPDLAHDGLFSLQQRNTFPLPFKITIQTGGGADHRSRALRQGRRPPPIRAVRRPVRAPSGTDRAEGGRDAVQESVRPDRERDVTRRSEWLSRLGNEEVEHQYHADAVEAMACVFSTWSSLHFGLDTGDVEAVLLTPGGEQPTLGESLLAHVWGLGFTSLTVLCAEWSIEDQRVREETRTRRRYDRPASWIAHATETAVSHERREDGR